jgi:hypothetical protein
VLKKQSDGSKNSLTPLQMTTRLTHLTARFY